MKVLFLLALAIILLAGCGSSRSPADKAVAEIAVFGFESRLATDLRDGAGESQLVADTRNYIDAVNNAGYGSAARRSAFDSFDYIRGYCQRCGDMLADARP